MTRRKTPPFRADHVGSLLRPAALLEARERHKSGAITDRELKTVEDASIRDVVALQEEIGFQSATDGEFRRQQWNLDFLRRFANVEVTRGTVTTRFHTHDGDIERTPTAMRVIGRLDRPQPIFVEHFKFLKSVTRATAKITIPSPSLLHFRGGRGAIDENAYPDMADFYADLGRVYNEEVLDLAEAGCRYLQIDEVNFAYLCDPALRAQVRRIGEDPETLPHTYAQLLNSVIAGKPDDMAVCMHLCRGNLMSAWIAEGGYEPVAEVLFNEIDVDGYFLEYDTERAGGFEPLRYLPEGKIAVLGLVTTKVGQVETRDEIVRRIEEATRFCPLDRLALSPQCGFASSVEGNRISVEDEVAKLRLVVDVAKEIWG